MSQKTKTNPKVAVEPKIEIDGEVTRRIRQHARAHLKTEVCGVLIGDDDAGTIDIRASIEALTATQGGMHVTFTQDAWEEIYRVKDEKFPEERIVGWYHSHPGFGVFLSDHDLFIQQNFFSSPGQVAWVYDPHTDEEGCFGWVSGKVCRLSSLQVKDNSGSSVDHNEKQLKSYASPDEFDEEPQPRVQQSAASRSLGGKMARWGVVMLSHVAVLAVGFLAASFLFPHVLALVINPLTNEPRSATTAGHRRSWTTLYLWRHPHQWKGTPCCSRSPDSCAAVSAGSASFARCACSNARRANYSRESSMSEENKEVLRVSFEELSSVVVEPVASHTALDTTGAKSYGSIHEPSSPEIVAQEKASFFLNAWVYLGIAGLLGALLGWGICEPFFLDDQSGGHRWGNIWLIPLLVALMCIGFALAESIVERSLRKGLIRVGIALPLGIVLGFIFDRIANVIFFIGEAIVGAAGVQTSHNPAFWIARAIAWAVFGVAGGVVYGIIGRSGRKTGYGALGGAIGAGIGGLIFDPITFATHGGAASRGVGFGLLGLATGIAMGLVESALKDRWLYVTSGPLSGKQFILYKPQTSIGSLQTADIYLFKDREILPQHATLVQKSGRIQLIAEGPVYIAGSRVHSARVLETGNIIQVGRYSFRYQERLRQ